MDSEENVTTTEVVTTEVVIKTEETQSAENTTMIVVPQPEEKTVVHITTRESVTVEENGNPEENVNLDDDVNLEKNERAEENVSAPQKADLHIVINQQPPQTSGQQALIGEEIRKENNLIKAILVTIFCCLPLGIVAIIYANKTNTELANGNVTEAIKKNESTKRFIKYGLIVGLVVLIISIIVRVAA